MLILIIAVIMAIAAIWAGVGAFYGMIDSYLNSLSPESVGVIKYIPYLEYGTMSIIIGILVFQTYQIAKVKDK
ncbi:hypothetical protein EN12_19235 [Vibrio cholerae]|uniref:Uncharacterized protein n=1 Tax=Vibrio cholerae TaxID=666 RepID=A0A5B1C5H0_VIBCL|nr:hypothetical protein [Vibrio cholerae]AKO77307.1 hypothetical protein EN12_19235 [Vibrio cholerae]KAA1254694.1 hypothetical protein F0M16_10530 [Vibrio cholerae]